MRIKNAMSLVGIVSLSYVYAYNLIGAPTRKNQEKSSNSQMSKEKKVQYPFSLPDKIVAEFDIDTSSREKFNNRLLGYNIFHFEKEEDREFIRKLDPISIRFPHGLFSNWYDWEHDKYRVFGKEKFTVEHGSGRQISRTINHLRAIKIHDENDRKIGIDGLETLNDEKKDQAGHGFKMIWTFNMSADGTDFSNGSPVTIRRYKDLKRRGFEVNDIELGNENFYAGQRSSVIPNAKEYIKRAKSMSKALKKQDPNIKISIPLLRKANTTNPSWNEDLTQDTSYFDAVTVHTYIRQHKVDDLSKAAKIALTAREGLRKSIDDYAGKVAPGKPIWLSEWGVKQGGPNAMSVLGMADCYLFMSENQDRYHLASWFSVNGQSNSFLVWERYKTPSGITRPRIVKKPYIQKTSFGSAYEIIRSVFEDSTLLGGSMKVPKLAPRVDAVSARAVSKNGSTTVLAVNLTDKAIPLNLKIKGKKYRGDFKHEVMAFSWLGEEKARNIDENPLSLVQEGSDEILLPKFSLNRIRLIK